jgi:hypothetical protein
MTLNVNLEDVPFAILEAVRGRIMSNRRRLQENQEQQQQRPALQPKPQFRKFGADGRTWKRPEPAAIASDGVKLPYFYEQLNDGQGTETRPGVRSVVISSGNGQQSATATLPDPFPAQFPDLELPSSVESWAAVQQSGADYRPTHDLGRELAFSFPNRQRTYGIRSVDTGSNVLRTGLYSISRHERRSSNTAKFYLPLGNDKCLYVLSYRDRLLSRTLELGRYSEFNASTNELITEQIFNQQTPEYDETVVRHVAFVCSFTSVVQITPPPLIVAEIESRLVDAIIESQSIRVDYRGYFNGISETVPPDDIFGRVPSVWPDDPAPSSPVGTFAFVNATFPTFRINFFGGGIFPGTPRRPLASGYGVRTRSDFINGATPGDWFILGTPQPTANAPFTHEAVQSFAMSGQSIGELIKPRYYYGILDETAGTARPSNSFLYWRNGLPSGDLFTDTIPEPGDPLGPWAKIRNSIRPVAAETNNFIRVYISDWGNPQFCRQQAERWGVSNL